MAQPVMQVLIISFKFIKQKCNKTHLTGKTLFLNVPELSVSFSAVTDCRRIEESIREMSILLSSELN